MARLLSGRVNVTPPTGVSTDRYSYLKLEEAEPNAGVPGVDGYVLASNIDGSRFWRSAPGASAISGITIKDEGSVVGSASSVDNINFVSSNLTATASGVGATITFNDSPTFTDLIVSGIATFTAVKDLNVTGVATATTFQAPGGTYASGTDTKTDAALVIDVDSAIYTEHGGQYLRTLIENDNGAIKIGQSATGLIASVNLYPGSSGTTNLYHGGANKKLNTTTAGIEVTGTTDTDELIVSGVGTISGLKYPTVDGSANQVMATDGNGNLTLKTISDLQGFSWETDGQDFGLITDAVTQTPDNGLVANAVANSYTLGFIVVTGLIYPTQFVMPSFTVSTLPSVNPAGQMLFVTDETGGAVPAFSDGTNWRRVTDRAIVS